MGNVGGARNEGRKKKHVVDAHIKEISLWHKLPPLSLFGALDLGNLYVYVYAYIWKGKKALQFLNLNLKSHNKFLIEAFAKTQLCVAFIH